MRELPPSVPTNELHELMSDMTTRHTIQGSSAMDVIEEVGLVFAWDGREYIVTKVIKETESCYRWQAVDADSVQKVSAEQTEAAVRSMVEILERTI